jgi:hypothetical protein
MDIGEAIFITLWYLIDCFPFVVILSDLKPDRISSHRSIIISSLDMSNTKMFKNGLDPRPF